MNAGQAYTICAEMMHYPYNLKGTALDIYAALFYLTKKCAFLGSYQNLANWMVVDNMTLMRAIKKMQERGLVTVEKAEDSLGRYKFQANEIEGYPIPDYECYIQNDNKVDDIRDCQNSEEYSEESLVSQNEIVASQNELIASQNEPISKEKNQKKIYTKSSFYTKEEVIKRDKPTATTAFNDNFEVEIVPYPKTMEEVWKYAQEKQPGISFEVARDFFVYYSARGWRYKNNGIIYNWKAELFNWNQRSKRWGRSGDSDIYTCRGNRPFTRYQQGGRQEEPSLAQIIAEREIARKKERDRRLAEEHDKEASTPEALAARDRVCAKFGSNKMGMCS